MVGKSRTEFGRFGFCSRGHECPGLCYNLCHRLLDLGCFTDVSSCSGCWRAKGVLLIPIQLGQFYQGQFLVAQTLCSFLISRWFTVGCGCYRYNSEILCRFKPHQMQPKGSLCRSALPLLTRKPALVLGVG